jgi:hypothetical protein
MKKYVVVLLLLLAQNVCAMETFILNGVRETDEKCKLVAKYLHKYPAGRDCREYLKIKDFFKDKDRIVLSSRVRQYKITLNNIEKNDEGEEALRLLYENEKVPVEVKQIIFMQVFYNDAQQYYAIKNALEFVAKSQCYRDGCTYHLGQNNFTNFCFKPYFLSEISKDNIDSIQFFYGAISINEIDFDDAANPILTELKLLVPSLQWKTGMRIPCKCKVSQLKDLIAFLDTKQLRVSEFKQFFDRIITYLSEVNDEKGIREFISQLGYFKNLTSDTLSLYRNEINFGKITFNDEII